MSAFSERRELPVDEIIEQLKSGMTQDEVAAYHKVHVRTIRRRLEEIGTCHAKLLDPKYKKQEKTYSDLPVAEMLEKRLSGMSLIELGKEYGVKYRTVAKAFKEAGIDHQKLYDEKRLPKEQIIADFTAGMAIIPLKKKYRTSDEVINKIFEEYNVEKRTEWVRRERALKGREQLAIETYARCKSLKRAAEELGVCPASVSLELEAAGVDPLKYRKYAVNEHFFDKMDDECSQYWFGFILADGCVRNSEDQAPKLKIGLSKKDLGHLELFKRHIQSEHPIAEYKNGQYESVEINITSKILVDQLVSLGCIERKTYGFPIPTCVPDHLMHHMIRGYFDGDGTIADGGKSGKRWDMSMVGTESFLIWVRDWIAKKLDFDPTIGVYERHNTDVIQVLTYGGHKKLQKVMDLIYKDATIYLDRKHDRYKALLAYNKMMDERRSAKRVSVFRPEDPA